MISIYGYPMIQLNDNLYSQERNSMATSGGFLAQRSGHWELSKVCWHASLLVVWPSQQLCGPAPCILRFVLNIYLELYINLTKVYQKGIQNYNIIIIYLSTQISRIQKRIYKTICAIQKKLREKSIHFNKEVSNLEVQTGGKC